jgi:hypothetical protein
VCVCVCRQENPLRRVPRSLIGWQPLYNGIAQHCVSMVVVVAEAWQRQEAKRGWCGCGRGEGEEEAGRGGGGGGGGWVCICAWGVGIDVALGDVAWLGACAWAAAAVSCCHCCWTGS